MTFRSFAVLTGLSLAVLTAAPRSWAADNTVPSPLYGSAAETRGDFDTLLDEILGAIESEPNSPLAVLCIDKVTALAPYSHDLSRIEARLDPVFASAVTDAEIREQLGDLLAGRARARGDFEAAKKYDGNAGYVRRFATIGAFGRSNQALLHKRYAPEARRVDPAAALDGAVGTVRWVPLPVLGESAWIDPYSQLRQALRGVTYCVARVRSDSPRTAAVKVLCSGSYKVFVNGTEVAIADRRVDRLPNPVWTTARLEEGWNVVLVKLVERESFALKLCDPGTGAALDGTEEGDPLMDAPTPDSTGDAAERTYRTPLERIEDGAGDTDALAQAALAQMLSRQGRAWDAYSAWENASAGAVGLSTVEQANVLAAHGRFVSELTELPQVQRKLRAKKSYDAALEAVEHHHSARLRLARYENEDDHPDRAVKAIGKMLAENPSGFGYMEMARICGQREWEKQAIAAAESALEVCPNLVEAVNFLSTYDRRYGNHEQLEMRMRRRLEVDASDQRALDALVNSLRAQGKDAEALDLIDTLAKRWPGSFQYLRQKSAILRNLGRYDETLATLRQLAELVPQQERYPREIGEIQEYRGNREDALESYRLSLELDGFQPNVWRSVARLTSAEEDFAAAYEPDVASILAALPGDDELKTKYPKAVAITVLDHNVTWVREDGSATSIVHMIYKLLDEKAVGKYGNLSNTGELLEVKNILPDGTVMHPTGLRGRSYNVEGLVPGSIVQHRYVMHQRTTPKGYDGGQFFFQDFDFRNNPNPVVLSRWVVLAPKDLKLDIEKRNYDGDPEVAERDDGYVATTWEKRDMPRIEWEQSMPPREEIVPHVDYSPEQTMEDANWDFLASRDDSRSSPVLETALAQAVTDDMGDIAKLHALHEFVNNEITGDFGTGSGAAATLLEKAGDRGELFEALVRACGIPYRHGRAMPWRGARWDLTRPDWSVFNTGFLWIEPRDGAPVAHFPAARHSPFGLVPPSFRNSFAFLASRSGGEIITLGGGGRRTDDGVEFVVHLGAAPEDTRVSGTLHYRGPSGYRFKRRLEDMPQDDRRKFAESQLGGYFDSPTLSEYALPGLEKRGEPLRVFVDGTMPQYLSKQGDGYVASLGLQPSDFTGRFVHRPERTYDLVLNGVRDDGIDEIEIHLGEAFEVATLPEDHLAMSEIGMFSLTWHLEDGVVRIRRELHLQPARYTPDQYRKFVEWCKKVDDAEQRKIELRKIG